MAEKKAEQDRTGLGCRFYNCFFLMAANLLHRKRVIDLRCRVRITKTEYLFKYFGKKMMIKNDMI